MYLDSNLSFHSITVVSFFNFHSAFDFNANNCCDFMFNIRRIINVAFDHLSNHSHNAIEILAKLIFLPVDIKAWHHNF